MLAYPRSAATEVVQRSTAGSWIFTVGAVGAADQVAAAWYPSSGDRSPRRPRGGARRRRPGRRTAGGSGTPWRGRPGPRTSTGSRAPPGLSGSRRPTTSASSTARRCRVGRGPEPSVLVIVLSVGRVPVPAVHVVDVVAVLDRQVAAVGTVDVTVLDVVVGHVVALRDAPARTARAAVVATAATPRAATPPRSRPARAARSSGRARRWPRRTRTPPAAGRRPTRRCRAASPRPAWSGTTGPAVARSPRARPSTPRRAAGRRCASRP